MKAKTKAPLLAFLAVLLVVATVFVTMAFLTAEDTVVNTFTVGKVSISLDEEDADDSTPTAARDQANKYHLIPGTTYKKDPVIHVAADSEDCWLFVKVENGLADVLASSLDDQMKTNGWALLTGTTDVWYQTAAASAEDDVKVFESFTIKGEATYLAKYANAEITVTAYAVQKDGFAAPAEAWSATFGTPPAETNG